MQSVLISVDRCGFVVRSASRTGEKITAVLRRLSSLEKVPLVLESWHWFFILERAKPKPFFTFKRLCWPECPVVMMPWCVLTVHTSLFTTKVFVLVRTSAHRRHTVVSSHRGGQELGPRNIFERLRTARLFALLCPDFSPGAKRNAVTPTQHHWT